LVYNTQDFEALSSKQWSSSLKVEQECNNSSLWKSSFLQNATHRLGCGLLWTW